MFKKPQGKPSIAHTWMGDDGPAPSPAALAMWQQHNPGAHYLPDDTEDMNVPGFAERGEMAERPEPGDRPGQQQAEQKHDVQFTHEHMQPQHMQPQHMQHSPEPQHQMAKKGKPNFKPFKPFAPGKPRFGK